MNDISTESQDSTQENNTKKLNSFWIYSYFNSIILYDKTWIHNITGWWTPSSKTLLEEWSELNYNELTPEIQDKISEIRETSTGKTYTKDQIIPMLYPDVLNSSFLTLVNESKKFTSSEKENIHKALTIMKASHKNQFRDEWLPYYIHPLKIAFDIIRDWWSYEEVICWLLHDVIEDDKDIDIDMLNETFWKNIIDNIIILSKKELTWNNIKQDEYIKNLEKNQTTINIKWYDRINNISSTYFSTPEKREKYIKETEKFYVPFFEQHSPETAKKIKEILKYIKTNPQPTEEELQKIKQIHDSYVLINNINE